MSTTTTIEFAQDKPLTQKERIAFYKTSTATFKDDKNKELITKILQTVGAEAIQTEKSFRNIKDKFADFVKDFPDSQDFVNRWEKHYKTWREAFQASKAYAATTAASYKMDFVNVVLKLVSKVNFDSEKDVKLQKDRLKRFSEAPLPKTIPSDYEEIFTGLKNDIAKFRADFLKYLDKKGKELSDKVKQLEKDLKKLEEELADLNEQVRRWKLGLIVTAWFPIIGGIIAGTGLKIYTDRRDAKEEEVKKKAKDLAEANKKQAELQKMVTDFSVLDHDFTAINISLVHLSEIWSSMRSMSIQLSDMIERVAKYKEEGDMEEWEAALEQVKEAAIPLYDSLDAYSKVVTVYLSADN